MEQTTREKMRQTLADALKQAVGNDHQIGTWKYNESLVTNTGALGNQKQPFVTLAATCASCSAEVVLVVRSNGSLDKPQGLAIRYPCPNIKT